MKISKHKKLILIPVAGLLVVLLFVGGPSADSLRSVRYVWGLGHLFCFALWSYLFLSWRSEQRFVRQFGEIIILALLLGGTTEIIQSYVGREAAWSDLINDTIGAMVGIAFFAEGRKSLELYKLRALQVATVILVGWSLLPTGKVIVDDLSSWKQLPLLSGFENRLEVSRWNGSAKRVIDHDIYYSGKSSLRVELTTQRYSGIGLKDFPRNWNNFSAVSLQVYNPDPEPLLLHFRIHDKHHRKNLNAYSDRFNTSFDLVHGWNRLYVPLDKVCEAPKGRLLDLSHVAGMGLFVGKLDRSRTVYIDEVALLP